MVWAKCKLLNSIWCDLCKPCFGPNQPSVLFFDEPTSALDPEMTSEVLDTIEQLREQGSDLVLVTHEMGFARMAADRLVFLAGGRILEAGQTRAVFDAPSTVELQKFLGTVLKY